MDILGGQRQELQGGERFTVESLFPFIQIMQHTHLLLSLQSQHNLTFMARATFTYPIQRGKEGRRTHSYSNSLPFQCLRPVWEKSCPGGNEKDYQHLCDNCEKKENKCAILYHTLKAFHSKKQQHLPSHRPDFLEQATFCFHNAVITLQASGSRRPI